MLYIKSTPNRIVAYSVNIIAKYIDDKIKAGLRKQYYSLNPAELKRKITKLQDKLLKLNSLKKTIERNSIVDENPYEYIYR